MDIGRYCTLKFYNRQKRKYSPLKSAQEWQILPLPWDRIYLIYTMSRELWGSLLEQHGPTGGPWAPGYVWAGTCCRCWGRAMLAAARETQTRGNAEQRNPAQNSQLHLGIYQLCHACELALFKSLPSDSSWVCIGAIPLSSIMPYFFLSILWARVLILCNQISTQPTFLEHVFFAHWWLRDYMRMLGFLETQELR